MKQKLRKFRLTTPNKKIQSNWNLNKRHLHGPMGRSFGSPTLLTCPTTPVGVCMAIHVSQPHEYAVIYIFLDLIFSTVPFSTSTNSHMRCLWRRLQDVFHACMIILHMAIMLPLWMVWRALYENQGTKTMCNYNH